MAYRDANQPHAFKRITADIKANNMPSLVLLRGREQYLVNWSCQQLEKAYVNEAVKSLDLVRFEKGKFELGAFVDACETMPMFSERKMVIVEDLANLWKRDKQEMTDAELDELYDYLKDIPKSTLVVIMSYESKEDRENLRRNKAKELYKIVIDAGIEYNFDALTQSDLKKFVLKRIKSAGKTIGDKELTYIINESGYFGREDDYTIYNLNSDVDKITHYAQGEVIKMEDVEECLSNTLERDTFKLIDAISSNRKDEGFRLIHELLLGKPSGTALGIVKVLVSQVEIMLCALEMNGEGMTLPMIEKKLRVNGFRLKKAMKHANQYSEKTLRNILLRAVKIESDIKGGFLDEELALDMFLAEF